MLDQLDYYLTLRNFVDGIASWGRSPIADLGNGLSKRKTNRLKVKGAWCRGINFLAARLSTAIRKAHSHKGDSPCLFVFLGGIDMWHDFSPFCPAFTRSYVFALFTAAAINGLMVPYSRGQETSAAAPTTEAATEVTAPEAVGAPPAPSSEAGTVESEVQQQEAAAATAPAPAKLDTGNHAWMLASSALVLFMTAPGLAMFYGGLVRKKNVLGVIMQCIFLMGLMTVLWAIYGYSLAFGAGNKWIGDGSFLFLQGTLPVWDESANAPGPAPLFGSYGIPVLTHMVYQGMFFIITPALICGAFAERMKFSAMVVFSILWGTLVYCPLCHWVWGGGILAYGTPSSEAFGGGALDFAGGAVVHISSGISALICALVMGRRLGFGTQPMPPHNLTYTALGAAMLWVGWFGFNGGSALAATELAAVAFVNTHFAAATGALAWAGLEWVLRGKPSVLGACSGAVAGLVVITPASGHVVPMHALIMGVAAGAVCFFACTTLKNTFRYDDSLDAFGVHGVGGTLGAILTGVFATRLVNNVGGGKPLGLLEGGSLLKGQLIATGITIVFAIAVTFVLLKLIDAFVGLRVSQSDETKGLDLSEHGEEGYLFL